MDNRYKLFLDPLFWLGTLGVILALFLIYLSSLSGTNNSSSAAVGYIEKLTETVKTKSSGELHWNLAQMNQNLSAGDFVFTGENSTTVVNLKEYGKLILGPHSMVIIQPGFVQVEAGEVELQATRKFIIKSFGSKIKVSPNSVTKIINTEKESRVELSDQDKQDESNVTTLSEVFTEETPMSEARLSLEGLESTWNIVEGKRSIKIVTSSKFDKVRFVFKNPNRVDKEFTVTSDELTLEELPSGNYQAEAYAYYKDEIVGKSEARDFRVINSAEESPRIKSLVEEIEVLF